MCYIVQMNVEFLRKWKSQVKKGILSFIVLKVLKNRELYGYELIEEVKRLADVEIAEGTLYPLMNRLKNEGLVTSVWVEQKSGIPRKYYRLTATGRKSLKEMHAYWLTLQQSIEEIII